MHERFNARASHNSYKRVYIKQMKVLIIKMSSLGDILHTLPALTDAGINLPGIQFDWVIEEAFAEIPAWHPLVRRVIPIAFRKLRKTPLQSLFSKTWRNFRQQLKQERYDLILDAQGLLKSVWISSMARGPKAGLDKHSAWEPIASLFYQRKYAVNPAQHAVTRARELFAKALGYGKPQNVATYGISQDRFRTKSIPYKQYVVFLHGTTWQTKLWPENYWQALANILSAAGYQILLPWGNEAEQARAERIVKSCVTAQVLPKLTLTEMATILCSAKAVVAVDTGLGHVAAALGKPTVSLYGPTDPKEIGTLGDNQVHLSANFLCAPCLQRFCTYQGASDEKPACFTMIPPDQVWQTLQRFLMTKSD